MLIENFKMHFDAHEELACTAPCSMYSVLLQHGLIKDPFDGLNELELTKLSEKDCRFEASFWVDDAMFANKHQRLTFYGLDTICAISLNGKPLAKTMNMHRSYAFELKGLLQQGENTLTLEFASPMRYSRAGKCRPFGEGSVFSQFAGLHRTF